MDPHADALDIPPTKPQTPRPSTDEDSDQPYDLISIDRDIGSLDISTSQEETRAKIALLFTQSFLILVVFSLVLPFAASFVDPKQFPNPMENAKNLLTTLTSVLAGPFGFIVGFYFKQNNNT